LKTQPGGGEIKPLDELKARLLEVEDLKAAASLLRWDQMTYMPPGGGMARGRQMATLSRLAHEKFTDAAVGRLLDRLEKETALPADSDEAALIHVTRRLYEQSVRVPTALVVEFEEHIAATYRAWTVAKPANDFPAVRPLLEKTLDLSRAWANCFPGYASIADPLIELDDYGLKASGVREVLGALRARLVPLMRAITSRPRADVACLRQYAPAEAQLAFGVKVVEACGYDFARGRLDLTAHPFTTKFSLGDVRITTRVSETDVLDAVFTMLHECGHALYQQGIRSELDGTPLATIASFSVDESQSRLWENLVGRSQEFWQHFYPRLQQALPRQFTGVDIDTFYRAINCVEPSLVRGSADEVTYNLHVILRFDLELDLLEGRLAIADLPRAWRERFEADFGIPVPDDRDGVLQDVHWYAGRIGGAFHGYTLGNVMSAQFFAAALAAHPGIRSEMASGRFGTLHGWLRDNLYQDGAKFTGGEALRRATGMDISIAPYLEYLWRKYQPLYGLERREFMADGPPSMS
jgi:carboxypeptidase Taq